MHLRIVLSFHFSVLNYVIFPLIFFAINAKFFVINIHLQKFKMILNIFAGSK